MLLVHSLGECFFLLNGNLALINIFFIKPLINNSLTMVVHSVQSLPNISCIGWIPIVYCKTIYYTVIQYRTNKQLIQTESLFIRVLTLCFTLLVTLMTDFTLVHKTLINNCISNLHHVYVLVLQLIRESQLGKN